MTGLVLRIYEAMRHHRVFRWLSLGVLTVLLGVLLLGQSYQEDISDFLPLNSRYQHDLQLFQQTSGADRIVVLLGDASPDTLVLAVRHFTETLQRNDHAHMVGDLMSEMDIEKVSDALTFVYSHIPYFLTPHDYQRIDSLLATPQYVARQLANDKQMLMFPVSGLLQDNFQRDPLNLFTPVVSQLQQQQGSMPFESYDGHIFTPDMQRALVLLRSPFGASETEHNAQLVDLLQQTADSTAMAFPEVDIHFLGGPVIAVGNARQIKHDSLLAISLAVVLIVALLFMVFRRVWPLLLIVLSIAWGWLFAMGVLAVIHDSVSVIVIGISSVILGIAVNYPLHLIAHLQHTPDIRSALKEIVMPLVVGNITTVGAFLALVPLDAVALRDLGLFSSLLLVGTIVFVLLYLPHLVGTGRKASTTDIFSRLGSLTLDDKRWVVAVVLVLTVVFGYFSLQTSFDANMTHINYMTPQQRQDMAYFQQLFGDGSANHSRFATTDQEIATPHSQGENRPPVSGMVYVTSTGHQLCSEDEQQLRLRAWNDFTRRHAAHLQQEVAEAARTEGFAPDTFDEFNQLLQMRFAPLPVDSFDIHSVQTTIASHLSDDFNYIGWVCGLIVFFFLWFSLGSIELALLSFLPMAVSWVWILGIMALLGIQFNVVNVILATFIFGQGDDYTIFMTEGCQYEYAYRRKMLSSYKHSIVISALIMFIGIGTLILAKHPALHSLAEVTIVGMFSVVLMAYLFPPLIFRWLVTDSQGRERRQPLTWRRLLMPWHQSDAYQLVSDRYRYRGVEISVAVNRRLRQLRRGDGNGDEGRCVSGDGSLCVVHMTQENRPLCDDGWGETALLLALLHPDQQFTAVLTDDDRLPVARHAAEGLAPNLIFEKVNK